MNTLEMTMVRRMSGEVLVGAATSNACAPAFAKDLVDPAGQPTPTSYADPFPISVVVTPGTVPVAKQCATTPAAPPVDALTISGQPIPAPQRPMAVSIRSDSGGDLGTLRATPDVKSNCRLSPPSPIEAGVYQVMAVAPDGRPKASVARPNQRFSVRTRPLSSADRAHTPDTTWTATATIRLATVDPYPSRRLT